jgi:hypothetical protein
MPVRRPSESVSGHAERVAHPLILAHGGQVDAHAEAEHLRHLLEARAEAPARMPAVEVVRREVPASRHGQRERVPHGQHGGRAGGGGQLQGTRLHHVADGQVHVAQLRQVRIVAAADADARDAIGPEDRGQVDDLLRAPGVTEENRHIPRPHSAKVPVHGLARVEEVRRLAEAAQRGRHLGANEPALAHAAHDHMPSAALEEPDRARPERGVLPLRALGDAADRLRLGVHGEGEEGGFARQGIAVRVRGTRVRSGGAGGGDRPGWGSPCGG